MSYENILLTIDERIAHIRLNRPAKRNAVNNGCSRISRPASTAFGPMRRWS